MRTVALIIAFGIAATMTFARNRAVAVQPIDDPLPACNPFGALASTRPIDQTCGLHGDPGGTSGEKAQDVVKNNFCGSDTGSRFHTNCAPQAVS
jgi:hypothetical protein